MKLYQLILQTNLLIRFLNFPLQSCKHSLCFLFKLFAAQTVPLYHVIFQDEPPTALVIALPASKRFILDVNVPVVSFHDKLGMKYLHTLRTLVGHSHLFINQAGFFQIVFTIFLIISAPISLNLTLIY